MLNIVTVGDLPNDLKDGIVRDISAFSIGFTRVTTDSGHQSVDLLGSGTLVQAGGRYAILTAEHVIGVLPNRGRLGVLLWSGSNPHTVDTAGVSYLRIARGSDDAVGPDIGIVILSATISSAIAAQKSFYNLDLQREAMLSSPPSDEDGFWVTNGFIEERTTEDRRPGLHVKRFFNLCALGGAERMPDVGKFDYYFCAVSAAGREQAPNSFGGMSGGALWQIPIARDKEGTLVRRPPLLSGVVFYQVPVTETDGGVRCHGRRTIYEHAHEAILAGALS